MTGEDVPRETRAISEDTANLERLILYRLDENARRLGGIESRIRSLELEVQSMRVKAGVWGLLAGLVPASIIVATQVT